MKCDTFQGKICTDVQVIIKSRLWKRGIERTCTDGHRIKNHRIKDISLKQFLLLSLNDCCRHIIWRYLVYFF